MHLRIGLVKLDYKIQPLGDTSRIAHWHMYET